MATDQKLPDCISPKTLMLIAKVIKLAIDLAAKGPDGVEKINSVLRLNRQVIDWIGDLDPALYQRLKTYTRTKRRQLQS